MASDQLAHDQTLFVLHLEERVQYYIPILEGMFGPRDPTFVFGTVRQSEDRSPRTHFPGNYHTNGGCVVDIHVGKNPWEHCCYDQGTWQIAHECVHLLDPQVDGSVNNLEEGLATWFQDDMQYHDKRVKQYIARDRAAPKTPVREIYAMAKRLVDQCMPDLFPAIKVIRETGTKIEDIEVAALAAHLPQADTRTIETLCARFVRNKVP